MAAAASGSLPSSRRRSCTGRPPIPPASFSITTANRSPRSISPPSVRRGPVAGRVPAIVTGCCGSPGGATTESLQDPMAARRRTATGRTAAAPHFSVMDRWPPGGRTTRFVVVIDGVPVGEDEWRAYCSGWFGVVRAALRTVLSEPPRGLPERPLPAGSRVPPTRRFGVSPARIPPIPVVLLRNSSRVAGARVRAAGGGHPG